MSNPHYLRQHAEWFTSKNVILVVRGLFRLLTPSLRNRNSDLAWAHKILSHKETKAARPSLTGNAVDMGAGVAGDPGIAWGLETSCVWLPAPTHTPERVA